MEIEISQKFELVVDAVAEQDRRFFEDHPGAVHESLDKVAQDSGVADARRLPPLLPRGPDS